MGVGGGDFGWMGPTSISTSINNRMRACMYECICIYLPTYLALARGAFHEERLQVTGGAEAEESDGGEQLGVGGGGLGVGVACLLFVCVCWER